jgi:Tfp pilus assembly protein PilF
MEQQALKHLESEEWTEARRDFESELSVHPKNLEARYNLALLMQMAGHHDQELQLYQTNMGYGWHLPSAINLSSLYRADGKAAKAKQLLESTAKHFKHEATPRYILAEIEEKDGHIKAATDWYEQALRADPLNAFTYVRYARFLSTQKKFAPAVKYAEKATRLQPTCAPCFAVLGDVQSDSGHPDDSLESYQKSLAIEPALETRQKLINALRKTGDHERADRMQQALDAWFKHQDS